MRLINERIYRILTLIAIALLVLIPAVWFFGKEAGVLINGIDTNFPLDPKIWFVRRFFVWNSVTNGGIDFSSSTAGLFFHFIQAVPFAFGFGLTSVQIISLIFWFGTMVISAFFLGQLIIKNRINQILFVVLYVFNIYLFNTWENIKVANIAFISGLPLFLAILIMLREKKISYRFGAFLSIFLGVIVSGTGINPAYFLALFLTIFLYFLGSSFVEKRINVVIKNFLDLCFVSFIVILINLFWILPTSNYILSNIDPLNSIDKIGFTNWIDSLSENTSLMNIMRGQGAWDWYAFDSTTGLPLYIPYALNYFHRIPFLLFSFLIPSIVILSLIFKNKEKYALYSSFGIMFIIGVFLGVGTHLPTGSFYSFLYYHVPFFTFFRSPWYIFTPLVILSTAGLISLFFDYLLDKNFQKISYFKPIMFLFITFLIAGNLIYSYPLVSGRIFRPGREDSFYVVFPTYVFESKKWLENNQQGRIINYPEDEIENFKWGYRGIESILGLLVDKELLFSPLNAPDAPIAKIIKEFYYNLKKEQFESVYALASKLNLYQIFEKTDQKSILLPLPQAIKKLDSKSIGEWNFYQIPQEKLIGKIYASDKIVQFDSKNISASLLTILGKKDVLVDSKDSVLRDVSKFSTESGILISSSNSQVIDLNSFLNTQAHLSNRILSRDLSKVDFKFNVQISGRYKSFLERFHLEDFGINESDNLQVKLDGKDFILKISGSDDSYVYFNEIFLESGEHILSINLKNENIIIGGHFDSNTQFSTSENGQYKYMLNGQDRFLEMLNKTYKDFYITFPIKEFDPLVPYMITVRYKQIYGNHAQILVGQSNEKTLMKTQVESLPNFPEWQTASFYFDPVKTLSRIDINLIAPQTKDPLGTTVEYDDLELYRVFTNNLILMKTNESTSSSNMVTSYTKIDPSKYIVEVENAVKAHLIVFSENYSPHWKIDFITDGGEKINVKPLHFSANLYANAWYIEGAPDKYKISIYYNPQTLFWVGLSVSIITFVSILIINLSFLLKVSKLNNLKKINEKNN